MKFFALTRDLGLTLITAFERSRAQITNKKGGLLVLLLYFNQIVQVPSYLERPAHGH